MGLTIDLDAGGDVGLNNASKLHTASGELPSAAVISQVEGNRGDEAASDFTNRLEWRSEEIAKRVKTIREFVAANAEALSNAVESLRESDRLSATAAEQTTALIDDVAAGKSLTGGAAGAAAGASATSTAGGAKAAFGG